MKSSTVNERCGILVITSSIFSSSKSVFLAISLFYTVGSAAAQMFRTKAPGLGPSPVIPAPPSYNYFGKSPRMPGPHH
jgi:hypothetical protein